METQTRDTQPRITVDEFQPGDEADILAMNLEEYGPKHVIVTRDGFHWRYSQNPSGHAEITVVRDVDSRQVIGFTWTIPVRMRLYGKDHLAALTANQVIHPDYRATFAYALMSRSRMKWIRKHGIPFRYNFPTETTFASVGEAEKMSSFLIPLIVRPLDTVSLAKKFFKRRWLGSLFGYSAKFFTPIFFANHSSRKKDADLRIEQVDRFDDCFDSFWQRLKDKYKILTIRDRSFLSWRFAPVDGRAYRILVAFEKQEMIGYVILRVTDEIKDIPVGLLMDLLLEPGIRGESAGRLLLQKAWHIFREEKVWLAGSLALPHTDEYAVLRQSGYHPLPRRLTPRLFRVAFNCFDKELPETTQVKKSDLFFTIADYEAH